MCSITSSPRSNLKSQSTRTTRCVVCALLLLLLLLYKSYPLRCDDDNDAPFARLCIKFNIKSGPMRKHAREKIAASFWRRRTLVRTRAFCVRRDHVYYIYYMFHLLRGAGHGQTEHTHFQHLDLGKQSHNKICRLLHDRRCLPFII